MTEILKNISNFDNNKLGNIQNITNLKVLRKNDLFCIGTNNSKLMIIKLKDNFSSIELVQEINLPDSCVNNIEIFNYGRTLIVSNDKHILAYELKEDDNDFKTYELKKDINLENNTYILKIDNDRLAAFISPDIIRIYNIKNYEFIVSKEINNIKCEITSSNQKQYKLMNLVGKNNDILAICSNEKNIFLIEFRIKEDKNGNEEYSNNFERAPSDYNNWFLKHSMNKNNDNDENNNDDNNNQSEEIIKTKLEEESKIINNALNIENNNKNLNIDNNSDKNTDFNAWFEKHSKSNIITNYDYRYKYDMINCSLNECQNNFVSVINCHDDYLFLLDNSNKVIVALIEKNNGNIVRLKFIGSFDLHDIISFTPFGLYLYNIYYN